MKLGILWQSVSTESLGQAGAILFTKLDQAIEDRFPLLVAGIGHGGEIDFFRCDSGFLENDAESVRLATARRGHRFGALVTRAHKLA
jgi:hypothetical protein